MRENRRTQIVSTAVELARADGLNAVTYDAIARSLDISKAGVVYHFPQRRDVLRAMVEQTSSEVALVVDRRHDDTGEPRLSCYVTMLLDGDLQPENPGLTAAIATDAELAQQWRGLLDRWTDEIVAAGVDGDRARTAHLAATAGVWTLDRAQLACVRRAVLGLLADNNQKEE